VRKQETRARIGTYFLVSGLTVGEPPPLKDAL
jgi:hypothetical protein